MKECFLDVNGMFLHVKESFLDVKESPLDVKEDFLEVKGMFLEVKEEFLEMKKKKENVKMDKTSVIFGNVIDKKTLKRAAASQKKLLRKFGDDRGKEYHLCCVDNDVLTSAFGAKVLTLSDKPLDALPEKSIIIGNIRMGFGHYRISMAMASAARALGYTPLWLDLNSFKTTTCTKIISYQNELYSLGSRLSQKSRLFNKLYWEKLNYEGFKKLTYNAVDQKNAELMTGVLGDLPRYTPFIATHVWPSQAAVHAGFSRVVNAIPDNWAMALHLSEGALHTVQTPSSYVAYRTLSGFDEKRVLKPMGEGDIAYVGHYVDDELVRNIEADCFKRIKRAKEGKPLRFLLTIGGAGAQGDYFASLIKTLIPYVKDGKAAIYVNIGDYENVWQMFKSKIPELEELSTTHFDVWEETLSFSQMALDDEDCDTKGSHGVHVFCHKDIFAAVYATNVLMRACDVLVTKPSELSFYPVPKLFIAHVGGHEKWGAVRSAEIGDGTIEMPNVAHAQSMIKEMAENRDMVVKMCNSIIAAKKSGIYNGAYHAVELSIGLDGKESRYAYAGC